MTYGRIYKLSKEKTRMNMMQFMRVSWMTGNPVLFVIGSSKGIAPMSGLVLSLIRKIVERRVCS